MQKFAISEQELATRWGISPKTLQRWRSEGIGPKYLKLSKRVAYPMDEILIYESNALRSSTWERATDVCSPNGSNLVTAKQAAEATSLPLYVFCNRKVRDALGLPYLRVNSSLRFNLQEVMSWARRWSSEVNEIGDESLRSPAEHDRTLKQALAKLSV